MKSRLKWSVMLFSAIAVIQSCGIFGDSVSTPSGIKIDFLKRGNGELPEFDDVLHFHLMYSDHTGKVLYDSRKREDPYKISNLDMLRDTISILPEVFRHMKIGDSVTFKVPYTRFYPALFRQECPKLLENEFAVYHASLFLAIQVDEIQKIRKGIYEKETALMNYEDSIHRIKQSKIDSAILENYLVERGIETTRTSEGVHIKMMKKGTGPIAKHGSTVTIDYIGRLLDERIFNDSYKTNDPMSFVLGFREVIRGWDDTIKGMAEGTKATLYIPSTMAYGNKQSGPMVTPNSILIYDIEVVKVR